MEEHGIPAPADEDDVEAHGLKETVAAAAALGALAVPAASQAYVPNLESPDRIEVAAAKWTQTAKTAGKKSVKKKAAKTTKAPVVSPKKPLLEIEEP